MEAIEGALPILVPFEEAEGDLGMGFGFEEEEEREGSRIRGCAFELDPLEEVVEGATEGLRCFC